ncbi:hypothetical protein LTS18_000948, partial [Coniosporium uncinatum]
MVDGGLRVPENRSLVQQTLKSMAQSWSFIVEYEVYNLATLPVALKSALVSYLTLYGPEEGVGVEELKVLFSTQIEGSTGHEELRHLDLTGFVGVRLALADLTRWCTKGAEDASGLMQRLAITPDDSGEQLKTSSSTSMVSSTKTQQLPPPIADSWEDALELSSLPVLSSFAPARFANLTHLSLAHPQKASWKDLLAFTPHVPTLTHLSLAYWPPPTMTPNAKSAVVEAKNGQRVSLGGSNYYGVLDGDWEEAANILRRLSNITYRLKHLDLEGCYEWLPALTHGLTRETTTTVMTTTPTPMPTPRSARNWSSAAAVADAEFGNKTKGVDPESSIWRQGWSQ